jgi:hypothetical protein
MRAMNAAEPTHPPRRLRRLLTGLIAAAIVAPTAIALSPQPAAAAENFMMFRDGSTQKTFGPNGMILIDGTLEYDDDCRGGGIKDFLYPATDVYIIPTGGSGGRLVDAGGNNPNTIVGQASQVFIDELIGVTSPSGSLGPGPTTSCSTPARTASSATTTRCSSRPSRSRCPTRCRRSALRSRR